jgi:DNA-binding transcriptional LysR family regulator
MDTKIHNTAARQLTLRQLFYFATVAEELQFNRAAERLHVSQPPLTQRIQSLERELGLQLFVRAGNRIELTEAGRVVLTEAQATLAQADRVHEVARRVREGDIGTLRVLVSISVSFLRAFRAACEAFQRDHPSVVLTLSQTAWRTAIEELQQRKVDTCVLRWAGPLPAEIKQIVVARDRLMLVMPSNHPKAIAKKVALHDVADDRFIQFMSEKCALFHKQVGDLWTRSGLIPRVTQTGESGLAILALVAGGFGNAILPSTLREIHMPNVVWKPIDAEGQWTSSSIVMLYRPDAQNERIQSRFVDYVRRFSAESN